MFCFGEVRKFHNLATNTNKNRYSGIQEIYKATEKDVWAFEGWARNKIYEAVRATVSATGHFCGATDNPLLNFCLVTPVLGFKARVNTLSD